MMSALKYMEKMLRKHSRSLERETERNAPEDVLRNLEKKIGYYAKAVEALKKDRGEVDATD